MINSFPNTFQWGNKYWKLARWSKWSEKITESVGVKSLVFCTTYRGDENKIKQNLEVYFSKHALRKLFINILLPKVFSGIKSFCSFSQSSAHKVI